MKDFFLKLLAKLILFIYRFNRRYISTHLYKAMLGSYGKNVGFRSPAELTGLHNVYMEDFSNIHPGFRMISYSGRLIMKKYSGAAVGLTVITGNHQRTLGSYHKLNGKSNRKTDIEQDVIVGEDVWIGANVTLCAGVNIGRGATVGAGSVVRTNIPPYAQVYGNPAKVVGYVFTPEQIIEHEKLLYSEQERIGYDVLVSNFEAFYGKRNNYSNTKGGKVFKQEDYDNIFIEVLKINVDKLQQAEYKITEGWDSVGQMSLIVEIEKRFSISFSPDNFLTFKSYQDGLKILSAYGIQFKKEFIKQTFPSVFFDFSSYREHIAVKTSNNSYTYNDLDKSSKDISTMLNRGKVAFLLAKNTIGSIACYVGAVKNHIPVAVLDAHKDVEIIEEQISRYRPEYIMLPTNIVSLYEGEIVGEIYDYTIMRLESLSYVVNTDLALLLTTSGSTGSPKFVRLSENNIKCNAESIAEYLNITEDERPITSLPMYYSYGISIINSHFIIGATIILTEESVTSPEFWRLAKDNKATSVSGVPYTYEMFKKMRVLEMDIPSLRTFTQAGGKMSKENVTSFAEECKRRGKKLIVMYGQTEASPRISYLPFEKTIEKSDSIGIPIPGGKLLVSNDGELVYEGPNVFQGYAESYKDLAEGDEHHGVLYTGDLARVDNDGYFYITGRKKRFLKLYGNRIGLDELEQLISNKFGKVACVGVDDHVTIYSENATVSENDLIEYVSEKTKINKLAFTVRKIESLPYSETGKIQYSKLEIIE